jgi:hypothetical protein
MFIPLWLVRGILTAVYVVGIPLGLAFSDMADDPLEALAIVLVWPLFAGYLMYSGVRAWLTPRNPVACDGQWFRDYTRGTP